MMLKKRQDQGSRSENTEWDVRVLTEADTLMNYLALMFPHKSRNKVKSLLTHGQVFVNMAVTTRHDAPLKPGDEVRVGKGRAPEVFRHPMMNIVYEDNDIIVIEKRNGLLSIATDKELTRTAYHILSEHVKRSDAQNRIFVVHRLDRETSGLMMYAKNEQAQSAMQREWAKKVTERRYVAVVEGRLPQNEGKIEASLVESKVFKMYVDPAGEMAVTAYRVLTRGANYSLVELMLETGKKNQIRAHLEHVGCPIAGDKKYGAVSNPAGRVCLHAHVLHITHPITGVKLNFSTRIPSVFEGVVKKQKRGGSE